MIDQDYRLWVYEATILNDGAASGDHTYLMSQAAGDVTRLLYGAVRNADTSARTLDVDVFVASTRAVPALIEAYSLAAGGTAVFPRKSTTSLEMVADAPVPIPSNASLRAILAAVAISQDSAILLVCEIQGQKPTVALTYPLGATPTVATNEVY